jgi:hypothetical protein
MILDKSFVNQLVPRIGADAARLSVQDAYLRLALLLFGLSAVVVRVLDSGSPPILIVLVGGIFVILFVVVLYTRIRLAKAMSKYIGIKIPWYSLPRFSPIEKFDAWLARLRKTGKPGL